MDDPHTRHRLFNLREEEMTQTLVLFHLLALFCLQFRLIPFELLSSSNVIDLH